MNIVICVNPAKSIEEKQYNFPLAQFVFAEIWHSYLFVHKYGVHIKLILGNRKTVHTF